MAKRKQPKEKVRGIQPIPAGHPDHDEWLLDESVEESFPASDPAAPARPDSTLAKRYQTTRKSGQAKGAKPGKRRG